MSSHPSIEAGAERFSGFADLYDRVRPAPPRELGSVLSSYCGGRPDLVVDLGSGTGLSCRWASEWAAEVVGIEPNDDMRLTAEAMSSERVQFRQGWSHDTGMETGCADAVIAVQSLHWMDPGPTFSEVARLLRPGGVFAAIDCDWPPVVGDAVSEHAWDTCRRLIRVYETRLAKGATDQELRSPVHADDQDAANYSGADAHRSRVLSGGVRSWSKSDHLDRMISSGKFGWCREMALAATEEGDGQRFIGLLKSQGDYQTLKRHGCDDIALGVAPFTALVESRLGDERRPWHFSYRARLGFSL